MNFYLSHHEIQISDMVEIHPGADEALSAFLNREVCDFAGWECLLSGLPVSLLPSQNLDPVDDLNGKTVLKVRMASFLPR